MSDLKTTVNNLLKFNGKTVVITGSSKGIGLGIAKRFHEAGANIVIADIDQETSHQVSNELNDIREHSTHVVKTDVADESDVKHLVEDTIERFGAIDILVNNAGIFPIIPLSEMTLSDFNKVIDINLRGVFLTTKYVSGHMKERGEGGRIINITSIDALHPSLVGLAHYDASKHGVWGFTKNTALELAKDNIWVNAIAPGGINTPGAAATQSGVELSEEDIKAMLSGIPMQRMGEPDDIAKVALFLASDMASYMTGSQIVVDGGLLLA